MKHETRVVSLVYLVYLVCLVERDKPDEQDRPDQPSSVSPVSLGYPAEVFPCCAAHADYRATVLPSLVHPQPAKWLVSPGGSIEDLGVAPQPPVPSDQT